MTSEAGSPGAGVTGDCELPGVGTERNSGSSARVVRISDSSAFSPGLPYQQFTKHNLDTDERKTKTQTMT